MYSSFVALVVKFAVTILSFFKVGEERSRYMQMVEVSPASKAVLGLDILVPACYFCFCLDLVSSGGLLSLVGKLIFSEGFSGFKPALPDAFMSGFTTLL